MPISHGHAGADTIYNSSAFFIRHDASGREFLFFGDVEPDRVSLDPRLRDVWCAAAPKIPDTLSTIFIECSYPLERPDHMLWGHLSPENLLVELTVLAEEVVKARTNRAEEESPEESSRSLRPRKKQRRNPVKHPDLRGVLRGVRVYIIHCKEGLEQGDRPTALRIADQVRSLVDERGLGAEIIAATQGMHISEQDHLPLHAEH